MLKGNRENEDPRKQSRNVQCLLGSQPKCSRHVTCCVLRAGRPDSTWPHEQAVKEFRLDVWVRGSVSAGSFLAAHSLPELELSSLSEVLGSSPFAGSLKRGSHLGDHCAPLKRGHRLS